MSVGRCTAITLVLAAVLAGSAWAEEHSGDPPRTLAVLSLTATEEQAVHLESIDGAIRTATPVDIQALDFTALRARRDSRISEAQVRRVDELRAEARAHFLEFNFTAARRSLELARDLLRQRHGDVFGDPVLGELDFELARVLLDMNERDTAMIVLAEVARCCPTLEPSADDYPTRLLEAWEEVRQTASESPVVSSQLTLARVARIGTDLSVTFIVSGTLETSSEGVTILTLRLIDSERSELLNEGRITLGEPGTWLETLAIAVPRLLSPTRPPEPPPPDVGRVLVLSVPPGAEIDVDGVPLEEGRTPMTIEVSPGRHLLTLRLDGHADEEVSVNTWLHQTQPLEVVLNPLEGGRRRSLWWVWTLLGVVVAGAATGLIYWGVTESQERPDATINIVRAPLSLRESGPR